MFLFFYFLCFFFSVFNFCVFLYGQLRFESLLLPAVAVVGKCLRRDEKCTQRTLLLLRAAHHRNLALNRRAWNSKIAFMGYQPGRRRLATHTSLLNARTHSQSTEQSAHSMYTHTRTLRHSTRAEPPPAAAASSKQQQRNSSKRVRVKRSRTQQSAASKNVKKTTESALLCSLLLPLPLCLLCAALSLVCLAFAAKTSFQCCVLLPVTVRESARVRPFCIAALSVLGCVCACRCVLLFLLLILFALQMQNLHWCARERELLLLLDSRSLSLSGRSLTLGQPLAQRCECRARLIQLECTRVVQRVQIAKGYDQRLIEIEID